MTVDVLAIGAHPDDVEIGCGGTLAQLARGGHRVAIAHLTSGEAGTRGTPEQRRAEAAEAAKILGAAVHFLDCGDGGLRCGRAEEDALIALIRELAPGVLLTPPPRDRHPDHERAHRLCRDAAFYAGLVKRGAGSPHRPRALLSYMLHTPFEPQLVVDVSESWETKQAALDAYESQLYRTDRAPEGPATTVSSPEFRAALEGRARHYGLMVGAVYGEPLASERPLRAGAAELVKGLV